MGGSGSSPPDSPTTQAPTRHLVVSPGPKPALPVWEREEVQEMLWGETMKTLLVWIILASSALATEPRAVITGPKESRPGALVVLDATESTGIGRMWLLAVSPEPTSFLPVESGLKCIFASPTPGEYVFILVVSGTNANGGPAAAMAQHTVTLLGPRPPPLGPTPNPTPTPTPTPGAVSRVVIIEESGDRTPEQGATLTDPRLLPLRQAGKLLILDQDAKDSQGQPAAELAQHDQQALPRVLGLDSSGLRAVAAELPGTIDGLLALLKTWGVL